MKDKPHKIKVSVSLDEETISTIKELKEQYDRNISSYTNKVLKDHIQQFAKKKS